MPGSTRGDGDGRVELLKLVHASATQLGPESADLVLRVKARTTDIVSAHVVEATQGLKSLDRDSTFGRPPSH